MQRRTPPNRNKQPPAAPACSDGRRKSEERRRELVEAAFQIIAERGFEGLRTREVAERVGVNVATMHYHFRGKEALIEAVADYLSELYTTLHAPPVSPNPTTLDRLRQEFADVRFYWTQYPEIGIVHHELLLRAKRDASIRPILLRLEQNWRQGLLQLLLDGQADGTFRADLDCEKAVDVLLSFLRGVSMTTNEQLDFAGACATLEKWLLADPKSHTNICNGGKHIEKENQSPHGIGCHAGGHFSGGDRRDGRGHGHAADRR